MKGFAMPRGGHRDVRRAPAADAAHRRKRRRGASEAKPRAKMGKHLVYHPLAEISDRFPHRGILG